MTLHPMTRLKTIFGFAAVLLAVTPLCAQDTASATTPVQPVPPPTSGFTQSIAAGDALHITAGRSIFITTKARLRRVYVANPAIVDSYMANPNQVVITAKVPGVSSLILWDEAGMSQAYQVSSDVDVDSLVSAMHQALPHQDVVVKSCEGRVLLSGTVSTDADAEAANKLATVFAKDVSNAIVVDRSRIKQVQLKVRIIEVDRSKLFQFGVNLFSLSGNNIGASTTGQFSSNAQMVGASSTTPGTLTTTDPLNFLYYNAAFNIGAALKDLENKQLLQILAEPTITSLNGQKASFLAGGEFPFPVVQGGAGGQTSISVSFRQYGVKVDFTPFVNADGTIELKIAPEVSALDYTNAVTISGYTIPALSTRRADTQVTVHDGQSFAISGLLDHRTTDLLSKAPGIASVPILGQFFKSKGITHSTTELIVVVTPIVVNANGDNAHLDDPKPVLKPMTDEEFDKSFLPKIKKK
jgi:pilus assembly protein CpaC